MTNAMHEASDAAGMHQLRHRLFVINRQPQQRSEIGGIDPAFAQRLGEANVAAAQDLAAGAPVGNRQMRGNRAVNARLSERQVTPVRRVHHQMTMPQVLKRPQECPRRERDALLVACMCNAVSAGVQAFGGRHGQALPSFVSTMVLPVRSGPA